MFHKPIKKELAALVESKKPKYRLHPKSKSTADASPKRDPPNDASVPSGSGPSIPISGSSSLSLRPKQRNTTQDLDDDFTPSGKHTDYQILSAPGKNWKYNVMKFAESRDKDVELMKWKQPIKLNRKDYRPPERSNNGSMGGLSVNGSAAGSEAEDIKKTPMLGPDGKPVIGPDGRIVMVGPDGKVVPSTGSGATSGAVGGSSKSGSKPTTPNGKGKFKAGPRKKIKQVFLVPEEVRKLRREERYPWVIEEAPLEIKPGGLSASNTPSTIPGQVWVGHLENPEKNQTHGLLIPEGPTFRFVPSHRFYKFTKRRADVFGPEEAEAEYAKLQKSRDPAQLWKRRKAALSEATLSTLKSESQSSSLSLPIKTEDGADFDDLGKQLRTVDAGGEDLFGMGDDDEEEKIFRKRKDRELGQEGDLDEMEYEEEFADDDEKMEMDGDDEEVKEMEERLKKEYHHANKARDATIDENDEEEDMEEINHLTGAGRDLKKLVKKTEKNEAYESDDDEGNPYASEEEEEEPPPPPVLDGPAVMNQQQQQQQSPSSSNITPVPVPVPGSTPSALQSRPTPTHVPVSLPKQLPHAVSSYVPKPSSPSSRPGSPLAGGLAPGMGNAIVAKRATSPKVGKTRPLSGSGMVGGARSPSPSPLGGIGSKAGTSTPTSGGRSPVASRAGSPAPLSTAGAGMKRKALDEGPVSPTSPAGADPSAANRPHKKSKRPPTGTLDEAMIINFLRERKDATTKDCIQKFQPYLRGEERGEEAKKAFIGMVRKVAVVKNNVLSLREEFA